MNIWSRFLGLSTVLVSLVMVLTLNSCEEDLPPNPYDPYNNDTTLVIPDTTDPNSFVGLHKNIFKPTCANSGCHDGTFEPDFRTIESSYNSLVWQPIIKNDTFGTYTYRVVPGDVQNSMLHVRLTENLNGNSGVMPLSVDQGSDWPDKKDDYIQNVSNWIANGAKDMFGNDPVMPDKEPELLGIQAFANGSGQPVNKNAAGNMIIPIGTTTLDIWFAFSDDDTPTASLDYNKVNFSMDMLNFNDSLKQNLIVEATPQTLEGFEGSGVDYFHHISINPFSMAGGGQSIFIRTYVQDSPLPVTQFPEIYSANYYKQFFVMTLAQ